MKPFRLKADFVFSAENIDDAFDKVAEHFQRLKEGEHEPDLSIVQTGEISLKPEMEK